MGIVTQDDDFRIQGSSLLVTELEKMGACKEFLITIPTSKSWENIEYNKELLRTSTSKVIVMYLISISPHIYERLSVSDMKGKVWIKSTVQENELKQSNLGLSQTVSIFRSKVIILGFSEFLDWMHPSRRCLWRHFGKKILGVSGQVKNLVYKVAQTLERSNFAQKQSIYKDSTWVL